jgi:hypothetical protein
VLLAVLTHVAGCGALPGEVREGFGSGAAADHAPPATQRRACSAGRRVQGPRGTRARSWRVSRGRPTRSDQRARPTLCGRPARWPA